MTKKPQRAKKFRSLIGADRESGAESCESCRDFQQRDNRLILEPAIDVESGH
jgi:hypothetical protein